MVKKEWSMFTFMAGDNNLSQDGLMDVIEMEKAGSSPSTNVVAEMDADAGDFEGSIRWEITQKDPRTNTGPRKVMERIPEADSGDPNTLKNFLKWSKDLYPAQNYLVVLWNHGSGFRYRGWRGGPGNSISARANLGLQGHRKPLFVSSKILKRPPNAARNILADDMTRNSVDMIELGKALRESGFYGSKKIEVLGFDACLMNMLEVAFEMSNYAKYIVGSEELEPGKGWPYTLDVDSLKVPKITSMELVKNLVKNYRKFYNLKTERNQWPITQSAIDLSTLDKVAASVNGFGSALSSTLPDSMPLISRIREQVQSYAAAADYDDYCDLADFADLCKNNIDDKKVKQFASETISNLKKAVMAEAHLGDEVKHSHGLTIWLPETESKYRNNRKAYELLAMTKKYKGWNQFLATYHPAPNRKDQPQPLIRSDRSR
jgi:cysteine peptidase C11 family protein